jgi:hypothetical protein
MKYDILTIVQIDRSYLDSTLVEMLDNRADYLDNLELGDTIMRTDLLLEMAEEAKELPIKQDCINVTDSANALYNEIKEYDYIMLVN